MARRMIMKSPEALEQAVVVPPKTSVEEAEELLGGGVSSPPLDAEPVQEPPSVKEGPRKKAPEPQDEDGEPFGGKAGLRPSSGQERVLKGDGKTFADPVPTPGETVTVTWGREIRTPAQFYTYEVGPFTMTTFVQKGETRTEAMKRLYAELEAFAQGELEKKKTRFEASIPGRK